MQIVCTVARRPRGWKRSGRRGREEVNGERAPSFQPCLHPDLLDPAPSVCEPGRELREVHPAVVRQVLLLCLRRVRVGLVLFDPFHKDCRVSHSPYWVLLLVDRRELLSAYG